MKSASRIGFCSASAAVVFVLFLELLLPSASRGQTDSTLSVHGFVDVYYAHALAGDALRDRSYTTQPLRQNEFNLNLAMIDLSRQLSNVRGRFAFQTGTYVESNLAAEPPLLKNVLEASVGTRIGENLWIDLGVLPSHIGFEGILSRDDWNYSRSLVSDFSPFYEAGASVTWNESENVTIKGLILNGWQDIAETNNDKAVGTQIQVKPAKALLFNWSTFVGNERPDSSVSQLRIFNDFFAVLTPSSGWNICLVFDIGLQKKPSSDAYDEWDGMSLMVKRRLDVQWAIAGRVEYFRDGRGVLVPTGTPHNFQTASASVNLDFAVTPEVLWRLEGRVYRSKDAVYPTQTVLGTTDGFLALSAALSF